MAICVSLGLAFKSSTVPPRMVRFGRVLSRLISLEFTIRLEEKGFNKQLVRSTIQTLKGDIKQMMSSFNYPNEAVVVEDYEEASDWHQAFSPAYIKA